MTKRDKLKEQLIKVVMDEFYHTAQRVMENPNNFNLSEKIEEFNPENIVHLAAKNIVQGTK